MGRYVLVGAEDPFDRRGQRVYELAGSLADHGDDVTVFLVQNGVLGCRRQAATAAQLQGLAGRVTTLADDFSLRERGIPAGEVVDGVRVAGMDALVSAAVSDGTKVLWT